MSDILRVAVVGHTNTGKTSLLRTLARDVAFGQVSDSAGTTRHVEGLRLIADGQPAVELFDTPGMEDAIALLEFVDALSMPGERLDGPERVARFLATPEAHARFEQEAKVLRQMLASARKTDFGGSSLFDSEALGTFRQMQDERFADIASERGAFGMAKMIEARLALKG